MKMRILSCFVLALLVLLSFTGCESIFVDIPESEIESESTIPDIPESEPEQIISDMDIITRENHPTYYGSVQAAHDIWDDLKESKVLFGDSVFEKYTDRTIIAIESYEKEDIKKYRHLFFTL